MNEPTKAPYKDIRVRTIRPLSWTTTCHFSVSQLNVQRQRGTGFASEIVKSSLTSSLLPSPRLFFTDGARQLLGFGLGPIQCFDARFAVVHLGGVCVSLHDGWRALLGGTLPLLPSAGRAQPRGEDSTSIVVTDVSKAACSFSCVMQPGFLCIFCSLRMLSCIQPTYFSQLPFPFCQFLSNIFLPPYPRPSHLV